MLSFQAEGSGLRLIWLQLIAFLRVSEVSKSNRSGVSKPKPYTLKLKPAAARLGSLAFVCFFSLLLSLSLPPSRSLTLRQKHGQRSRLASRTRKPKHVKHSEATVLGRTVFEAGVVRIWA